MKTTDFGDDKIQWMLGPRPHPDFESNGCTLAPDVCPYTNALIAAACHWHDFAYSLPGTEEDRLNADTDLYWNIITLGGHYTTAAHFFRAVRWGGVRPYSYVEPPGLLRKTWLVASNFLIWTAWRKKLPRREP